MRVKGYLEGGKGSTKSSILRTLMVLLRGHKAEFLVQKLNKNSNLVHYQKKQSILTNIIMAIKKGFPSRSLTLILMESMECKGTNQPN